MTVAMLIEKLKSMPPNATVVIDMCSETQKLRMEEIKFHSKEERLYIERNGSYIRFREEWWNPEEGEPVFEDLCHFPGN